VFGRFYGLDKTSEARSSRALSNSVERFYGLYWDGADGTDSELEPTTPTRERLLLECLHGLPGVKRVLDAGCGSGYFLQRLQQSGYEVTGIDVSENAVVMAKVRVGANAQLYRHRLDEPPWPVGDGSFDAVWSSEVIEHIYGVYEYVAEANRVLRDGGHLILTTPFHGCLKNVVVALFYFDRHFNNVEGGHIRFFTRAALRTMLEKFGFAEVKFRTIGRVPSLAKSMFVVYQKRRAVRRTT
jgi:2-polyprenyl-3-methyl-5-hydroxy-6-metoxy-1,4-benzoquinol methylase